MIFEYSRSMKWVAFDFPISYLTRTFNCSSRILWGIGGRFARLISLVAAGPSNQRSFYGHRCTVGNCFCYWASYQELIERVLILRVGNFSRQCDMNIFTTFVLVAWSIVDNELFKTVGIVSLYHVAIGVRWCGDADPMLHRFFVWIWDFLLRNIQIYPCVAVYSRFII